MIALDERLDNWVSIVNRWTWQIFQLLDEKGPLYIREFRKEGFVGSPAAVIFYVDLLERHGLVSTRMRRGRRVKRIVKLTERGEEALDRIDELEEITRGAE